MSSIIQLSFHNESELKETQKIVLFQKYRVGGIQMEPVAWKVFENIDQGFYHPFQFEEVPEMVVKSANGIQIDVFSDVSYSQSYVAKPGIGGDRVVSNTFTFPLINQFQRDPIHVEMSKGGNVLIAPVSIAPGASAIVQFDQTLWVGITKIAKEGEVMKEEAVSYTDTGLSMAGVHTAEIVMSGGEAKPLIFTLRNIT